MEILFSDLDNTLIYSHRHELTGEKIPIEYLRGREQSYMTLLTYNSLINLDGIRFVPVSTRSEAQYRRLVFMDILHARHAIICNGGKLLIDGNEDKSWTDETYEMVAPYEKYLEEAIEIFASIGSIGDIKRPEIYMCYATADDPKAVYDLLVDAIGSDEIVSEYDARKVYLFIRGIDKGTAVKRYVERFSADRVIAAGDCRIDIPMLNEADYALAPKEILKYVTAPGIELDGDDISFPICRFLEEYNMKGKRI